MPVASSVDFFQYQDVARRKTSLLVFYYVIAVALIILAVYAAFVLCFMGVQSKSETPIPFSEAIRNPVAFAWVAGVTIAIVLIGTIYKTLQLSGGGEAVALMLGGRPLDPGTANSGERKVLNVVEEMAIASGTPVPRVFLMDQEDGINAFAAGFSTNDCVIGVTRGCIEKLGRSELQGVIAHEFSHIFNGDMRLNIRLIGVLNGILIIAFVGYWIMRSMGRGRSSSRGKGGGAAIALFGLLMMIVGYIGVFFGKLIQSAVSRQREYLADASAVQFTRNPDGIANALKKIGGFAGGSRMQGEHAREASHMFFANGLRSSFLGLMATHPPLEERIRRLDPQFQGDFSKLAADTTAPAAAAAAGVSGFAQGRERNVRLVPGEVISRVGAPSPEHLAYAGNLLAAIPAGLRTATHDAAASSAIVYALLLSHDEDIRTKQLDSIARLSGKDMAGQTLAMLGQMDGVSPETRLPLAELALGAMKSMDRGVYQKFRECMGELVSADSETDLFEYALERMAKRQLDQTLLGVKPQTVQYYDVKPLLPSFARILSCIAYWGTDDMETAKAAFTAGANAVGLDLPILPVAECGLALLDKAIKDVSAGSPAIKKKLISSCTACIGHDKTVTIEEAELLRAISESLDCPMPPFLPGEIKISA